MLYFPNAKLNLGLNIIRKRPDNYHDIQSIFLPINLKDGLEIIADPSIKKTTLTNSGLTVDTPPTNNLVYKVYEFFKNKYNLPNAKIHLHKVIPFGAGIGGGSADAAFTAKMLNKMFNLNIPDAQLIQIVKNFGADCPFFIINKPAFVTGIGEIIEPIEIPALKDKKIVLIKPDFKISTKDIFSRITPDKNAANLIGSISKPIEQWKNYFTNDFEKIIFEQYPELSEIKQNLYSQGAIYASMSGTGSTIYGIFEQNFEIKQNSLNKSNNYTIIQTTIL